MIFLHYALTGALWLSMFIIGVVYAVTGPILLNLAKLVNTEVSKVSWALTTRGLGTALGSLARGYLIDASRCRVAATIIAFMLLGGLTAAIPWSTYLGVMIVVFCLQGLIVGFIETDTNDVCIQLWGKKHAPYLMAVYGGVSAGGLSAAAMVLPFVRETPCVGGARSESTLCEKNMSQKNPFPQNSTVFSHQSETEKQNIEAMSTIHFIVMGICLFTGLFLAFLLHLAKPTETNEHEECEYKETVETPKIASRSTCYVLIALLSVYIFNVIGAALTYSTLLTTFVVKQLGKTETLGTQMTLFYSTVSFTGTVLFTPLSKYIPASVTILTTCIILVVSSLVLVIFGSYSTIAVWCASAGIALSGMVSYAAVFSWANQYIDLPVKMSSILVSSSTLGEMGFPAVMGPFLDTYPMAVAYAVLAAMVSNALIYVCVECVGRCALRAKLQENTSIVVSKNQGKNYTLLPNDFSINKTTAE
ncbi:sodium-dependent glucose transporter 1A-like [Lineus longissimus]|uniref:sodium-dependent glucose transporter 1A-like n=1 Tax=Lineus longissimus TaxID=88925 RepID=UPI00315D980F